jgi:hypothetical protein
MSPEQIARKYYELFNQRNFEAAAEMVDRAAAFRYLPSKQHMIGRAAYKELAAMWLHAFEDGQLQIASVTPVGADTVVVELVGRGTHTGDLVLGDAVRIPATGVAGALRFRETLRVRDGRIVDVELDFDLDELKRLLRRYPQSGS